MLFCCEHGIKMGIFRFKNQTGIKTEPILFNGKLTDFQAKYNETDLILGAHLSGNNVEETIKIFAVARNAGLKVSQLKKTISLTQPMPLILFIW